MARSFRQIERVVRGFANHRRIQILYLLESRPELDVMEIADACGIRFRNASEHLRRLTVAGLILKQPKGTRVQHALSPRGRTALAFTRKLA